MKKVILGSITLLSVVTLAACSSNSDTSSSTSSSTSTSQSSTTSSTTKVDNSVYDSVVKELNDNLNPDNDSNFTVEVENNVADSDFPDGHNVINITLSNEGADTMKQIIEAVDSNTADETQKVILQAYRQTISEAAKTLPDDTTTIALRYKVDADQYRVVALSSKNEDVIPVEVD
ncbi:hypothetical protein MK516_04310 [Streptococcus gallolyticus subsp. gallolyticus]|uniref:hypothetical protein n=1 Tax=Streptococcus gallolyticus TaxID=315405 RepID=UPI0022836F5E|nr:hypothetical protein [Streptococcus gallolyticus]MCY7171745.1 hypothetical protein [Streptococcus gallolyticus subsp. gallolyticus]